MTDTMLPIIRQMHEAETDARRAQLLLSVPDLILIKYRTAFDSACRRARFDEGEAFIELRINSMRAVRDHLGNFSKTMTLAIKAGRAEMFAISQGDADG